MSYSLQSDHKRFTIKDALPVYGPMALNFGTRGEQGFVVKFFPDDDDKQWVGNFRLGLTAFEGAYNHPNGADVIVISGGDILNVDPIAKTVRDSYGGMAQQAFVLEHGRILLIDNTINMLCIESAGLRWTTVRLASDGLKITRIEGDVIYGQSLDLEGVYRD